jgi:hypothetical protein
LPSRDSRCAALMSEGVVHLLSEQGRVSGCGFGFRQVRGRGDLWTELFDEGAGLCEEEFTVLLG